MPREDRSPAQRRGIIGMTETETETDGQTETEIETDIETETETDTDTDRQRDMHTETHTSDPATRNNRRRQWGKGVQQPSRSIS